MHNKLVPKLASKSDCTACSACVDICPTRSLMYIESHDGFYSIELNRQSCIQCKKCEKVCPIVSNYCYGNNDISSCTKTYAAWNNDFLVRKGSSSGGVFSALAKLFLLNGDYVVGAVIDGFRVKHIITNNINDLSKLQGTKYLSSNLSGVYKQVKELLKTNSKVLFSGIPCQVAGLKSFLSITYPNLYTVDLICGGVPSNVLVDKFVSNCGGISLRSIYSFRDKNNGWKSKEYKYGLKLLNTNGEIIAYTTKKNLVINGYGVGFANRASCYRCKFSLLNRNSDITIGDLWGDTKFANQHYNGVSLVILHNSRLDLKSFNISFAKINIRNYIPFNYRLCYGIALKYFSPQRLLFSLIIKKLNYKYTALIYGLIDDEFNFKLLPYSYKIICYLFSKIENIIIRNAINRFLSTKKI